jgi:hypothetical protein
VLIASLFRHPEFRQGARQMAPAASGIAAWFFWRKGVLGTMVAGMAVYLPLPLGWGW